MRDSLGDQSLKIHHLRHGFAIPAGGETPAAHAEHPAPGCLLATRKPLNG
jgi:hypothetical protein